MKEEKRTVGNLIRTVREKKKILREKLSWGICSSATLMRYEQGERIPDKFTADALLERMGIVPYRYEFITSDQEFQYRMLRDRIEKLQKIDTKEALLSIEQYEMQTGKKEHLHNQYIWAKRAEIAAEQQQYSEAEELFGKALAYTGITEVYDAELGAGFFSACEMRCLYGLAEVIFLQGDKSRAYCLYEILKRNLEEHPWDGEKRREYYPHILYRLAGQKMERNNKGTAYRYLKEAKSLLVENYQITHLGEICELLQRLQREMNESGQDGELDDFITALKILEAGKSGEITEEGLRLWENTARRQL